MDQAKIGRFIAESRKKQKLTQEQLAEQLGVSKNAVSKWERGICLMDMSLLKPLSEILDISVNEILAGSKISNEELKETTETNIVDLAKLYNLKSTKRGMTMVNIISIILILYCSAKQIPVYSILSLLFGYNAMFFYSKYKFEKNKYNLIVGIAFAVFLILNLIAFFISTIKEPIAITIYTNNIVDFFVIFLLGLSLMGLGIYNIKGNINSIHWYNRRKVTKENEKKYSKLIGIGTFIIGFGFMITSILQIFFNIEMLWFLVIIGVALGLGIILFAQIKYNKGLF